MSLFPDLLFATLNLGFHITQMLAELVEFIYAGFRPLKIVLALRNQLGVGREHIDPVRHPVRQSKGAGTGEYHSKNKCEQGNEVEGRGGFIGDPGRLRYQGNPSKRSNRDGHTDKVLPAIVKFL